MPIANFLSFLIAYHTVGTNISLESEMNFEGKSSDDDCTIALQTTTVRKDESTNSSMKNSAPWLAEKPFLHLSAATIIIKTRSLIRLHSTHSVSVLKKKRSTDVGTTGCPLEPIMLLLVSSFALIVAYRIINHHHRRWPIWVANGFTQKVK